MSKPHTAPVPDTAPTPDAPAWGALIARLGRHRPALAVGVIMLLLTNGLDKAIPWLLKHAVDALTQADFTRVQQFALAVISCALVMSLTRTYSRVRLFNVGRDIEYELRNDLLRKLHQLGTSFFRAMSTGDIMSRAINDLGQVRLLVGFGVLNLVNSVVAYVAVISLMNAISPELTLYALLPYPMLMLCTGLFARVMFARSRDSQRALGSLSDQVQETLTGIRLVRVFATEEYAAERFDQANQRLLDVNLQLARLRALMWPVLLGVSSLAALVVLWKGASMCMDDELTAGELAAFLAYTEQLVWPTLGLGYLLSVLQRGKAAYGRIVEVLDSELDVSDAPDARTPKGVGELEVRGLSYAYNGRPVLKNLSFRVRAGTKLAIVGQTGSGKSTLAALLARVLPTPAGHVFIDGQDLTELRLADLRRTLAYAEQEPFLFSTSIAKNVGFALDQLADAEAEQRVRDAAAKAQILDEVQAMPDGLQTTVGERGVQLSGGQKQRIALARALLTEPRVLVLDDPLSAVDAKTEAAILRAIDDAARGRTVILVTHRVAAARRADEILVLGGGEVVEQGDHEQLVALGGTYAALVTRQQLEQELALL